MRSWRRAIGASLLAGLNSGCQLPLGIDAGHSRLVVGYAARSEEQGLTRIVVPGIALHTSGEVRGLRLGWSDLLELRPRPPARAASPNDGEGLRFVLPLGLRWRTREGLTRSLGWFVLAGDPVSEKAGHASLSQLGLVLDWSELHAGLSIGASRNTWTRLDPSVSGFWQLEQPRSIEESRLTRLDEPKEE